jgi:V8-like Glu-specific endopeptidase
VIGYPSGLPAKLAGGAKVFGTASPFFFSANLDTFGGNSGSPVFNAGSNRVVGILVRGAADYRPQGNCNVVNVLANTSAKEEATRISLVRPFLGPASPAAVARLAAALER